MRRGTVLGALALAAVVAVPGLAQDAPVYDRYPLLWAMYFADHALGPRVSLVGDAQLRRAGSDLGPQQNLLRVGVLAQLGPGVRVGGGYAFAQSFDYGDFTPEGTVLEHRAWQQLSLSHGAGAVGLLHRFRLEERWIAPENSAPDGGRTWTFQWRVRYMIRGVLPLAGDPARAGHLYTFASDELFIRFGSNAPLSLFDQNRLFVGAGVTLARHLRLEASWLNLILVRGDGARREVGNGAALGLTWNAPL